MWKSTVVVQRTAQNKDWWRLPWRLEVFFFYRSRGLLHIVSSSRCEAPPQKWVRDSPGLPPEQALVNSFVCPWETEDQILLLKTPQALVAGCRESRLVPSWTHHPGWCTLKALEGTVWATGGEKDILSLVQLWTLWSRPTCQVRCAHVLILTQLSSAWIRKLVFKVFLITWEFMTNTGPHYFRCSMPFLQMRTSSCNELIRVEKLSLTYYHI